jgi:hypothetical protein
MPHWMLDTSNLGFWAFWHFVGVGLIVTTLAMAAGAVARTIDALRGRGGARVMTP